MKFSEYQPSKGHCYVALAIRVIALIVAIIVPMTKAARVITALAAINVPLFPFWRFIGQKEK